jgi:hypothetical protein
LITIPELAAETLGSFLAEQMGRRFGSTHPDLTELIPSAARLALECIGNSDALYHDVEHTMLVTLAGYDIMKGRALLKPTYADDFAHLILACLFHDIGYVRGILAGDDSDGYVTDGKGGKTSLPRGSSDAALMPYHVDRSKLFVMDRIGASKLVDASRIARAIEFTRFPSPPEPQDTENEEGLLVRAADFIGQLGDPHYLRKANALYYEFEEVLARRSHRLVSAVLLEQRFGAYPDGHSIPQRHLARAAVDRRPLQQCLLRRARAQSIRAKALAAIVRLSEKVRVCCPRALDFLQPLTI